MIIRPLVRQISAHLGSGDSLPRNALVLAGGTFGAQLLLVASVPVITRIYTPEQTGLLGIVAAVALVLTPLTCWRYEQAIMLPRGDRYAIALVGLCILLTVIAALVVALILLFARQDILRLLDAEALGEWIWLLPPLVLASGFYLPLSVWHARQLNVLRLASGRLTRSGATVGPQLGIGALIGGSAAGLIGGQTLGFAAQVAVLSRRVPLRHAFASLRKHRLLFMLVRRYRKFALFSVPGGLLSQASFHGMLILIAGVFGSTTAGYFWLTDRVLAVPVSLISQSIGTLLYQRLTVVAREPDGGAGRLLSRVFMALFLAALIPAGVLMLTAPWLFGLIFGDEWTTAGQFTQAMIPRALAWFAIFPINQAFLVYEKQEHLLYWQAALFVVPTMGLLAGVAIGSELAAVWIFSLASAVIIMCALPMALNYAGVRLWQIPGHLAVGASEAFQNAAIAVMARPR